MIRFSFNRFFSFNHWDKKENPISNQFIFLSLSLLPISLSLDCHASILPHLPPIEFYETQTQLRYSVILSGWMPNEISLLKYHAIECHYKKVYRRHQSHRFAIKTQKRRVLCQRKCPITSMPFSTCTHFLLDNFTTHDYYYIRILLLLSHSRMTFPAHEISFRFWFLFLSFFSMWISFPFVRVCSVFIPFAEFVHDFRIFWKCLNCTFDSFVSPFESASSHLALVHNQFHEHSNCRTTWWLNVSPFIGSTRFQSMRQTRAEFKNQ